MPLSRLVCGALSATLTLPAFGDYAEDCGFNQLKAELGAALVTGAGVGITQVEATGSNNAYMPQAGSGTFPGTGTWEGKIFTAKNSSSGVSFHAFEVGLHIYGNNTSSAAGRASMAPGVVDIDCYNASNWDEAVLSPLGLAPLVETRAVQNHSWISQAEGNDAATVRDLVRREDFAINRDNFVCSVGISNDPADPIPDIFAAAYNVISVGMTNGVHSRGTTTADMDGPGRRKPEIVAPLDFTSFSTAYVSSAAALLRHKAEVINTTNARRAKTLKAALLAGATKDEFPLWEKTAAHPIDSIYGAGELNIYNSYHIMDGGEQPAAFNVAVPPGTSAFLPLRAWDYSSLSGTSTADYRLQIPAGMYGVELSAFVVWHRTLNSTTYAPDALVNFDLTLFRDPSAGGAAVTIDSSTSTLYNIEHVWKKNLTAGNYRLRVSRAAGSAHEYAIAWRLTTASHVPVPQVRRNGATFVFTFPDLLAEQPYKFQSSPNLATWIDLESFTAAGGTEIRMRNVPPSSRLFYRLLPVLP